MCGILGRFITSEATVPLKEFRQSLDCLYRLSESRGKEASGLCGVSDQEVTILRADVPASDLIRRKEYRDCFDDLNGSNIKLVMGHSRMVTNGDASNPDNNQPIYRNDLVVIHNGIIVNDSEIWKNNGDLIRKAEVDTEVFLGLMEKYDYQYDFVRAFSLACAEIEGSLSIALVDRRCNLLFLYTNTGSLYIAVSSKGDDCLFASEEYILERTLKRLNRGWPDRGYEISQIRPGDGLFIDIASGARQRLSECPTVKPFQGSHQRKISVLSIQSNKRKVRPVVSDKERKTVEELVSIDIDKIHRLRRCTKCLLPETFPGIRFDENGVCNVCNSYIRIEPKGEDAFIRDLKANATGTNRYDCIAPISGGRDSCYILHYLAKEMKLKPVAYTYDWGLVTDLARRNIQRMCAALGIEHILISANIKQKRLNVRKNVLAWLKKPELGTIPLFMAGDKQFFYYAQLLKRQMKVDNVIFGMNKLEETKFKARFIGLGSVGKKDNFYDFSGTNKLKLFSGYGMAFLKNPAYINSSLLDSFSGFLSFYALPPRYLRFFDYIPWDQDTIVDTLRSQYNWEVMSDQDETWRIGDGTAPFYNYIYYHMAGFTEFDTFKSNQIREGMLTREEALGQIDESNRISIDGFLWYCHTIGIDPVEVLRIINSQRPLYEK